MEENEEKPLEEQAEETLEQRYHREYLEREKTREALNAAAPTLFAPYAECVFLLTMEERLRVMPILNRAGFYLDPNQGLLRDRDKYIQIQGLQYAFYKTKEIDGCDVLGADKLFEIMAPHIEHFKDVDRVREHNRKVDSEEFDHSVAGKMFAAMLALTLMTGGMGGGQRWRK